MVWAAGWVHPGQPRPTKWCPRLRPLGRARGVLGKMRWRSRPVGRAGWSPAGEAPREGCGRGLAIRLPADSTPSTPGRCPPARPLRIGSHGAGPRPRPRGSPSPDPPGTAGRWPWHPWEKRAPAPIRPGPAGPGYREPPGGRDLHPELAPLGPVGHAQVQARAAPLKTSAPSRLLFLAGRPQRTLYPFPPPPGARSRHRADFGPAPVFRVRPSHWLRSRGTCRRRVLHRNRRG